MPVVLVNRVVTPATNGLPGDGGEARSLSRSHDECLPLTESAQLPGCDPSVNGLVRVLGAHDAGGERSHCRARRGESAREGCDDDDAGAPGLGQERGPQRLRLGSSECLRQIRAQLRGIRECEDRGPVVADAFQQVDGAGCVRRQLGGRASHRVLANHVERAAGTVRDSGREGQRPLRGETRLVRTGLDLDASPVPDDGDVMLDAFREAERHGGTATDSVAGSVPLRGVIDKALCGVVDILPGQCLGQGRRPQGFGARARPRGVAALDH